MSSRFATETAVTAAPGALGRFRARVDEGWSIGEQPNGGYLAATLLRAIVAVS
ncbi:MAG: hypothetical protein JWL73_1648, partial [Actinomycetia bacterium]|nr:hypothetical protein [Actinomycetes bacterium]